MSESQHFSPLHLLVRRGLRAVARRSPVMLRTQHQAEMVTLGRAAESLCDAVRRASAASLLATRQWQNVALRYRQERDEALVEIEKLRATVASLVVGANGP